MYRRGRLTLHGGTATGPGDQSADRPVAGAALHIEQLHDVRSASSPCRRHGIVAGRGHVGLTIEPSHRSSVA
jgi:hypothetical protein